jgi:ornithine cyclodeaminase/alanine dehydrogenase-like protein (mu-crystallin family)
MPDGLIQQTQVGVTSALGMKVMARKDSQVLGLIGSGGQAKSPLSLYDRDHDDQKVKVFSPNAEHRKTRSRQWSETGVPVKP